MRRRKVQPTPVECLENPVDRGDWRAAVHRVAQSQTRLKQLSMHACFGEENGNPLWYSCLKNPRDRGAWRAAVYGVAESQMRQKRLISSSNDIITYYWGSDINRDQRLLVRMVFRQEERSRWEWHYKKKTQQQHKNWLYQYVVDVWGTNEVESLQKWKLGRRSSYFQVKTFFLKRWPWIFWSIVRCVIHCNVISLQLINK